MTRRYLIHDRRDKHPRPGQDLYLKNVRFGTGINPPRYEWMVPVYIGGRVLSTAGQQIAQAIQTSILRHYGKCCPTWVYFEYDPLQVLQIRFKLLVDGMPTINPPWNTTPIVQIGFWSSGNWVTFITGDTQDPMLPPPWTGYAVCQAGIGKPR